MRDAGRFFVARLSEAMRTRAVLPDAAIYVLDGLAAGAVATYANYALRPVIGTMAEVRGMDCASHARPLRNPHRYRHEPAGF